MKYLLLFFSFVSMLSAQAQTVIQMPVNSADGSTRIVGCGNTIFTDDGGRSGNYSNSVNGVIVFCPAIETDRMILDFNFLSILPGDVMTIYDGDSPSAPVLRTFTNTNTAPGTVQASAGNPTGCLTVRFISNNTGTAAGWEATRRCFDPCQTITPIITATPAIDADGILRICQGDRVQFNGSATFSNSGAGATYRWSFDTGNGFVSGQTPSHTFTDPGSYRIRFEVTDTNGCRDRDLIDLIVQVSTDPDFTGTAAADTSICLGETTTITGKISAVPFVATPAPPVTGQTFLPDGTGVSYKTCIDVDIFAPGAIFTNASDLISMFMNIEHSYAGDLDIVLTAPNGASVEILRSAGAGSGHKYLGNPIDDDNSTAPGIGFEYVITEKPSATLTFQNALSRQVERVPLPEGDYLPTTSFSNFIGSSLNGSWCLTVTDNIAQDNGYIFQWGLNFDPALIPPDLSFTPQSVREEWRTDPTIINNNAGVITVQPAAAGTKCYTYEFEDNFGCIYTEEVCIEVKAAPTVIAPNDLLICDNVGSVTTVDLTQNTGVMLAGQNPALFDVAYYRQLIDAENQTNPISNPATFTPAPAAESIYVTVTDNSTGCSVIRDFRVSLNKAIFNTVPDMLVCDDTSNDGFEVFDLSVQTSQILGTQSSTDVTVSYFITKADADSGTNAITNPENYTNQNSPQQTIYVRVENNTDSSCFASGTFELIIGGNPVANPVADFAVCDDASNNGVEVFVLNTIDAQILAGQNPADFEVTYYRNQLDADSMQNQLTKTGFQNTSNPQNIVARISSKLNMGCYETTDFDLVVNQKPVLGTPATIIACDDPTGDGIEVFDLTFNDAVILNGLSPNDYQISYYLSQANAENAVSAINSTYSSNQATTEIFVRVQNIQTGCSSVTRFPIVINPVPQINTVAPLVSCDDNNDGIGVFRLNDRLTAIRNGQNNVSVLFYSTQADMLSGSSPLNGENYQSNDALETIYYRSQFDATGCFSYGDFEIQTVIPPIAGLPTPVEICDSGNGSLSYDLSNSNGEIQNGQPNTVVTYYRSQADADSEKSPLPLNQNFTTDTLIYARLENTSTGCFDTTILEIKFNELPQPVLQEEVVLCRNPQGVLMSGPAVFDTGLNIADFDFEWRLDGQLLPDETDATLITEQQGDYEVTVTNTTTGCQNTATSIVRLAGPPDTFEIDVTALPFDENQRIEISVTGPDTYWFQLDDGPFQDSNIFEGVTPGSHSITISERNRCGSVTTQVFIFGYPKFFTPNNDGFNDTWNVAAGDRLPILRIFIFDRYGKLLKELSPTGAGWDGTFAGNPLPSADYWFKLDYEFEGQVLQTTGHFSLKR